MRLGNVLLACIGFMTSGTYGDCHDESLSVYVTGDGFIRVRLSSPDMVAVDGTILTRCGLRCACYNKMFLCCSDADCIAVDNNCPAHHLNFPPVPPTKWGQGFHAPPFTSVEIMDQSQKVALDPRVSQSLQANPVPMQNLDPMQGVDHVPESDSNQTMSDPDVPALVAHAPPQPGVGQSPVHTDVTISHQDQTMSDPDVPALVAHAPPQPGVGQSPVHTDVTISHQDQTMSDPDVPALVAHAPPQPGVGQSPVHTDVTISHQDIHVSVSNEPDTSSVSDMNPIDSASVSRSDQTVKKGRLNLLGVLKNDKMFTEEYDKEPQEVPRGYVEARGDTTSPRMKRTRRDADVDVTAEQMTTEEVVILSIPTESPAASTDNTDFVRRKRSDGNTHNGMVTEEITQGEERVTEAETEASDITQVETLAFRKKRSAEYVATEEILTTEDVIVPPLPTEAPDTSNLQMPPMRKKRSPTGDATEEVLTTEEVSVPPLPTEAPDTSDLQMPTMRKK
ncbi:uncharacterized protein LOC124138733 isoform X2 [Haliotis rufescens]|nr:uncharacterized protein LOC124138733 isoform X2 [Haliotis rufescens]XP_048252137.1 uncharacterized protein LOC124138733 isoform X2 [Haliotis rufescens]